MQHTTLLPRFLAKLATMVMTIVMVYASVLAPLTPVVHAWSLFTPETFRGVWIEDTETVRDQSDWNAIALDLKNRGFTDAFANFTYAGGAYYSSSILPAWWVYNSSGDQLRMFINAMHAQGIRAHDWILAYNASYGMDATALSALRSNGDLAMLWDYNSQSLQEGILQGGATTTWLNYNSSDVRDRLVSIAEELATNYPDLDGIHFDYMRSVGDISTYDNKSKAEFAADTGINIATSSWPAAVMPGYLFNPTQADGPYRQQYVDWQAGNITHTLELIKSGVHAINPALKVSVAVFPSYLDPYLHAQDWEWWDESEFVDMLMPMDYTTSTSSFSTMLDQDYQYQYGNVPLYPGINFKDTSLTVANGLAMIDITRQKEKGGFMFYERTSLTRNGLPSDYTPPAVALSFTANPTSITSSQSSLLTWNATNTVNCYATGAWSGYKAVSGTHTVWPTSTSTYTLSCAGVGGTTTSSVTVGVH